MSKRICVFGDSIARGYYDLENGGWVNRLWLEVLKITEFESTVYNCSISGDTTRELFKRMEVECVAIEPNAIVIALGANDACFYRNLNSLHVPEKEFIINLKKLINIARRFTNDIILVGPASVNEEFTNPVSWGEELYYYNKNISDYSELLIDFSRENNLKFIPMFDLLSNEDLFDGLHPNAKGHEKMFNRVKEFLLKNKII